MADYANSGAQQHASTHGAGGVDRPEISQIRLGFIPLTDCASVVMACELKLDEKYGIKIALSKERSWASVRDKLVNGELHAAHALYGMIYGLHTGIGGPQKDMAVLMTLNQNGQAITLSNALREQGVSDGASLARLIASSDKTYTFAQTFPTGTHAMWLNYWLAAQGIDPYQDVRSIVIPPPQMVAHMRAGHIDGYCAGEPWNQRAIADGVGFTVATSQDVWANHPEKVLGTSADFVQRYPRAAQALISAVLEASRWLDASPENRRQAAELIAAESYVNTDVDVIADRMLGHYSNGLGRSWNEANPMRFYDEGKVNFPYLSDGMWFLSQHRRWGLLEDEVDYLAIAKQINQTALYAAAANAVGTAVPESAYRSSSLIDGLKWDGSQPQAYVDAFVIRAACTV